MRPVFADTSYWVATLSSKDQWAEAARIAGDEIGKSPVITTEEVLIEVLNEFAEAGPKTRARVAQFVHDVLLVPRFEVIQQSHESFEHGLNLYETRPDKGYSLTDCISMNAIPGCWPR